MALLQRDIFDLVPDLAGQFDYVIEHTCFCAIDPSLRSAYAQLAAELLAPGGELLAVFFTHSRGGGPPLALPWPKFARCLAPISTRSAWNPWRIPFPRAEEKNILADCGGGEGGSEGWESKGWESKGWEDRLGKAGD